ncbi:MAG: Ribonuclease H [Candidatus Woesebacteria bacterium GW2011_GWA1_43_12]|uniref:Ribonuclease H n=1 Tax=Candidatus Woesebacteria bacterium GW2011_GWA1_43_12 TaxID=1618557 RepID=A0A0G1FT22_9BACT|nr:MAG: Ribonuclease H [Candidatus Woesebacteria bacterium GW2011_GWA1_43_12]
MRIHTDGGARGNPGPAACAFVATDENGSLIHQQGFYLGVATNNQAEYQAVIEALKWLSQQTTKDQRPIANFYLDSQLVVNQLKGLFKVKDENLKIKKFEILDLITNYKLKIKNFAYVPRSQNAAADLLVNQTLDQLL